MVVFVHDSSDLSKLFLWFHSVGNSSMQVKETSSIEAGKIVRLHVSSISVLLGFTD